LPLVTVISYLDGHQGAFTALLTVALIAVTIFYAIQNVRMVNEMAKTRKLAVLPKLMVEFHRVGPAAALVAIKNVGPGAALDVDVTLVYDAAVGGDESPKQRWRRNILSSGEQFEFIPPGDLNDNINTIPLAYKEIRLTGEMTDATGARHIVNEFFADLPEWRAVLHEARQRWVAPDPERRLADELSKKMKPHSDRITTKLDQVTRALNALRPPPGDAVRD
jgi:hypothetical protein